jgi:hypothetical protein
MSEPKIALSRALNGLMPHLDGVQGTERTAMAYDRAKAVNAVAGGGIDWVRLR